MTWKKKKLWLFCSTMRLLKNFRCWATANFTCRDLTTGGSQSDGLKFLRMRVVLEIWMKPSIGDRFLLKGEYWAAASILWRARTSRLSASRIKFSGFGELAQKEKHLFKWQVLSQGKLVGIDSWDIDDHSGARWKPSSCRFPGQESSVKQSTLNPIWHETFDFHVQDARQDMLIAEVWNDEIIGRDYLGSTATTLTRVLQEYAFEEKFRLVGVPSGRLYLRLSWENSIGTSVISDKPSLLSPSEHFPSSHGLLQLFPMDVSPNWGRFLELPPAQADKWNTESKSWIKVSPYQISNIDTIISSL